jgi:microcystin-dependent protein
MSEPYLSEIRLFSFAYAPRGWALCQGQTLQITQNNALYALLGTTFGGNGTSTFGLPDFRGRAPLHTDTGLSLGAKGGTIGHTLTLAEMPAHNHLPIATSSTATRPAVAGSTWAATPKNSYGGATNTVALATAAITATGGGQAHSNEQPYLPLNFSIALQGIFPSRT